jgi:heat shock protein HslJ
MPATAAQDLTGGPWRWAGPEGKPVAPERYTVEFTGDGRVLVLADCNRGSSRYTQEAGGRLTLTPIATTKMACAAGSQDTAFLRQLGAVESYRIDAGVLVLQLGGGETMRLTR